MTRRTRKASADYPASPAAKGQLGALAEDTARYVLSKISSSDGLPHDGDISQYSLEYLYSLDLVYLVDLLDDLGVTPDDFGHYMHDPLSAAIRLYFDDVNFKSVKSTVMRSLNEEAEIRHHEQVLGHTRRSGSDWRGLSDDEAQAEADKIQDALDRLDDEWNTRSIELEDYQWHKKRLNTYLTHLPLPSQLRDR